MVTWSNVGAGPGNLDFALFATQVPAQAPAGMSWATTVSGAATNSSVAARKPDFIKLTFIFSVPPGTVCLNSGCAVNRVTQFPFVAKNVLQIERKFVQTTLR